MKITYILGGFLLILVTPILPLRESRLQDCIKGTLFGATIGDALGRITARFENINEIRERYGNQGLQTFDNLYPSDWLRNETNDEIAAYTQNSTAAFLVLEALMLGRLKNLNEDEILNIVAQKIYTYVGKKNYRSTDPLFDNRQYSPNLLQVSELIAKSIDEKSMFTWPKKTNDIIQTSLSPHESDSSGLMRAWPYGLVFFEDTNIVKKYVDTQMLITHRHPSARAAATALAIGISAAIKGLSPEEIVNEMVQAAEQFDIAEQEHKPGCHKISSFDTRSSLLISENRMLTSDMIRYALYKAQSNSLPDEVLGTNRTKGSNNRSSHGYLLGYEADEAIAATVYIFMRHHNNLRRALIEGANAPGNSALLGSLAGALVGSHSGIRQALSNDPHFESDLEMLESVNTLQQTSNNLLVTLIDGPAYNPKNQNSWRNRLSRITSFFHLTA